MEKQQLTGTIIPHSLTVFKGLTRDERLTLVHLLILKDVYRSETFFHSNSQFVDELGFTEMTAIKVLHSLQEKDFIHTEKGNRGKATEYTINISKIAELPKYSPSEKTVVQEVKEKLIETRGLNNAVVPQTPQESPKTESVKKEQPSTDTIPQTEAKEQPEIKLIQFRERPKKENPRYWYYPQNNKHSVWVNQGELDELRDIWRYANAKKKNAEMQGVKQVELDDLSYADRKDLKNKYITNDTYDIVYDLRESADYDRLYRENPEMSKVIFNLLEETILDLKNQGGSTVTYGNDRNRIHGNN